MLEESKSELSSRILKGEDTYIPSADSAIAPSILAQVFEDGILPFTTNPDGSVDLPVYMAWLQSTWVGGMTECESDTAALSAAAQDVSFSRG